jgi:hypothetical protein
MYEAAASCKDIAWAPVTNWEPLGVRLAGYCYAMRYVMKVQIVTPYRVSHLQRYGVTVRGNVTSVYPPLVFQLNWLFMNVMRVVFFSQMDLPKSFVYDVWPSTLCGPVAAFRRKFEPPNVLLVLLELSSKCTSLESLMKFYESGNDMHIFGN